MNTGSILKRKLAQGQATYGLWVTLESPSITEIAAHAGFDWVVIDAEHGHLDLKEVMEHVRVANLMSLPCMVRISDIHIGLIKRVLDVGADGILVPQVRDANDVARAVQFAKYPPQGVRGIGAERATLWGRGIGARVPRTNDEIIVVPLMETVQAAQNIDAILDVPGVDAIFFGPHDFAASAGYPGSWEQPDIVKQWLQIQRRVSERKVASGIVAFSKDDIALRQKQGFGMIALGMDTGLLIRAATEALEIAGKPVPPDAWQ